MLLLMFSSSIHEAGFAINRRKALRPRCYPRHFHNADICIILLRRYRLKGIPV